MKYRKVLGILVLIFTLLIVILPPTPALAQGNLKLLPASGEVGDSIEAWGSGLEAGQYDLYFSNEFAPVGGIIGTHVLNYESLTRVTGSALRVTGPAFEGAYFYVPKWLRHGREVKTVLGGTYYVYAADIYDKEIVARTAFTVEAVALITLNPVNGTVATKVEISGNGFGNTEGITVKYDGAVVNIAGDDETNSNGEFGVTTITIPPSTAGEHTITVSGKKTAITAEAKFTVKPKITIAPESGAAGSTVTVNGTGFGGNRDVTLTFGNEVRAQGTTDGKGSFAINFVVPAKSAASYNVEAVDGANNSATAGFTMAATTLNISPTTGKTGILVTVEGKGFIAKTAVTITFDTTEVATDTTDEGGDFSASFTVPKAGVGTYKVKATDGANTKQVDFTISTGGDIIPQTSLSSPGSVGTQITITGIGFTAGRPVILTYDGSKLDTNNTIVNSDGSLVVSFNAPASSRGEHIIVATDGTNTIQFSFFMESTPPPVLQPLKPEMGIKAKAETYFDWQDVTDPSGVSYTLQIAIKDDFSPGSIVMEKTGINTSEFTIPRAERLKSVSKEAPYYWRVKAVDGAANESQWTGIGSFYVGTSLALSQPVIYILIGVGALFLAIFGFWLGRKTAYY